MQTPAPRSLLLAVLPVALTLGACSSAPRGDDEGSTDADEAALTASQVQVVDDVKIDDEPHYFDAVALPAKHYQAVRFTAHKGDHLAILAASFEGDAIAYVLDAKFKTLAKNDDGTTSQKDSYVAFDVPKDGTYYVAIRDKGKASVEQGVSVRRRPETGSYVLSGTCKASGRADVATELTLDFGFKAGSVTLHGMSLTNASAIQGDLITVLTASTRSWDERHGFGSKLIWQQSGTTPYPWSESRSLTFDQRAGTLDATFSRYGSTVGQYDASCHFDASVVFGGGPAAAPFPASLEGQMLVAKGTCGGTNFIGVSCVPGTPGRANDGCCLASEFAGTHPAEFTFVVTRNAKGTPKLTLVSATSEGTTRSLSASATQTAHGFAIDNVAVPFTTTTLVGSLGAGAASSSLRFSLSGENTGGNTTSTCGADFIKGSCTFGWDAP